jgi:group I intron endonuclease
MIELMNNTGIYKLYYKGSDKFYVGSTGRSFKQRLSTHLSELRNGYHHNTALQRGYYKYGEGNLIMEPLIICDVNGMMELEEFAIICLKPSYNASKSGVTRRGVKTSEETKKKLSLSHKGKSLTEEHKKNISKGLLSAGIRISEEHKEKLRILMSGNILSDSTRQKIRDANIGRKQSYDTITKRSNSMKRPVNLHKYIFVHNDGTEVYETLYYMKINYHLDSHVHGLVSGKRKSCKGWSIKNSNEY